MTVGDLLRYYRVSQNKTLKEFAGNVIDCSYYNKVEKNIHQISINNLINLLNYNQINITEFIGKVDFNYENYQSKFQTQRKLMEEAFYQVDKDKLQEINLCFLEYRYRTKIK